MELGPQDRLRVCHLGKYYPPAPGGIETHVQSLARAQAALGADVQVACVNHADSSGQDITWKRCGSTPTVSENDGKVRVTRLGRAAHFAKVDLVPHLARFFRQLKDNPVDILHLHTPNPTMLLAVALIRPSSPMVITHHSDVVKQRKLYHLFAPFEGIVYGRAARVITNSDAYVDGSDRLLSVRQKVETVPMGLNLGRFLNPEPAVLQRAAELRAQYGPTLWLSVGRCVYYKGFDTALRALRHVPGKLMIIGSGPYHSGLQQVARSAGVADRVVWRTYVDDAELAAAYRAANALWFPSNARSEAYGLVQVEAMASGCPVINTRIPHSGVSWVSPHEKCGLTIDIDDIEGLAAAANRLLSDPAARQRFADAARQRAIDCFSDTTMASLSLDVYARVLGRGSRVPGDAEPSPAGRATDSATHMNQTAVHTPLLAAAWQIADAERCGTSGYASNRPLVAAPSDKSSALLTIGSHKNAAMEVV